MADGLQFSEVQAAQSAPGFDLAKAAQAATVASPSFSNYNSNPNSPVSSSSDFRTGVNNLNNNINDASSNSLDLSKLLAMFNPSSAVTTSSVDLNQLYEDRRAQLDKEREDELAQYNAEYNTGKSTVETNQAKDLAPIDQKLQLLNGTYGPNAAVEEQLNNQKNLIIKSYKNELDTLYNKREAGISQARNAYNDADFSLAEAEMKNAKDAQDQIYQKQKDFADLFLDIYSQQRQDATLALQQQKEQAQFNKDNNVTGRFYQYPGNSTVYDSITGQPVTYQQYVAAGGVGKPGATFPDVQVVTPQTEHSTAYKEWQDYTATGGKLNFNDYMNMDANRKASRTTVLTYNQQEAEQLKFYAQGVGSKLATKVGPDGYVSPSEYKTARNAWVGAGYAADEFDSRFSNYVNPANKNDTTGVSDYGNKYSK
jgi:hypothetical protein